MALVPDRNRVSFEHANWLLSILRPAPCPPACRRSAGLWPKGDP